MKLSVHKMAKNAIHKTNCHTRTDNECGNGAGVVAIVVGKSLVLMVSCVTIGPQKLIRQTAIDK